jgi:hypothetical protein
VAASAAGLTGTLLAGFAWPPEGLHPPSGIGDTIACPLLTLGAQRVADPLGRA